MSTRLIFTPLLSQDFKRTLWKNGLGHTEQIAISPPEAELARGDFDWRVSSARVEQASHFSPFPEYDRVLVMLDGHGARLTHHPRSDTGQAWVDLQPLEPYAFSGAVATYCDPTGGPFRDLGVLAKQDKVSAQVQVLTGARTQSPLQTSAPVCLIFAVRGTIGVEDRSVLEGDAILISASGLSEAIDVLKLKAGPGEKSVAVVINIAQKRR